MVKCYYSYQRALKSAIKKEVLPELTDKHVDLMFFHYFTYPWILDKEIEFLQRSMEDSPDPQSIKLTIDCKKMQRYLSQ